MLVKQVIFLLSSVHVCSYMNSKTIDQKLIQLGGNTLQCPGILVPFGLDL